MLKRVARLFSGGKTVTAEVDELVREQFDAAFYLRCNPDVGNDDPLQHYVQHGWREGRDPTEWFSVREYLDAYTDIRSAGIDPFWHYLRRGKDEGRQISSSSSSPSHDRREFAKVTGIYLPAYPEALFDAAAYAHAAGIPSVNRWRALAHFVVEGLHEPRLIAAGAPHAELLQTLGNLLAELAPDKAMRCLQLAFLQGSEAPRLLHELGEFYRQRDLPVEAIGMYRAALLGDERNFWSHFNLAVALQSIGDQRGAMVHYDRASRLRPERLAVRFKRNELADEHFWVRLARANSRATHGDSAAACQEIEAAVREYCELVIDKDEGARKARPAHTKALRIAIFGHDGISQCRLYRIQQKVDQLRASGIEADVYSHTQAADIRDQVGLYDILIVYRLPATPEVVDVIASARRFGVTTFFDVDDLIFDESRYPPPYDTLADVVTPVEYSGLITGRSLYRMAIELCDYGITSTPTLVEAMAGLVRSGKCFLSRNALGNAHMAAVTAELPERVGDEFVVFYGSGTKTHNADFALAAPGIFRFLRERPFARLHVMGPVDLGKALEPVLEQVVRLPFSANLESYWGQVAKADVNLAPLVASPFNDAKSEIKWMEAAMVGVPSIVSSSATYDAVVRQGEGFIARSGEDWYRLLSQLADDRALARRVGQAARERVLSDYGLPECSHLLTTALMDVLPAAQPQRKARLLVVNVFYPPEFIGGATRVAEQGVTDVCERYGDEFDVRVFCGREDDGRPGFLDRYHWNGVEVTTVGPTKDVDAIERSVATHRLFERFVDEFRPEVVHLHCIQGLSCSLIDVLKERSIPYVITAHDCWWISDKQFLSDDLGALVSQTGAWGDPLRLRRLRQCLEGAYATLAVSRSHAALYRSRGVNNVMLIGNGSESLPGVGWPQDDGFVWLGLLGGFHQVKGIKLLKKALKKRRYENLRFLAVDHRMLEGSERNELWGDNELRIVGKTSFTSVGKVFEKLHGVLAISTCFESFGLVSREAQRLGRWVIASNRGGMAEDLTPGLDGFVIDPANESDLVSILSMINDDPDRFRQPAPRSDVHLRTPTEVTDDLVPLYRQMLSSSRAGVVG
jgi:glycosyltransferase involved in cell wall biosynthesis/tetratricopeptide (TPR) repeat protein